MNALIVSAISICAAILAVVIFLHVLVQLRWPAKNEPPIVFHWIPILGSTLAYHADPYTFLRTCREKYGDVFTFVLLGRKTTVYLGPAGNEFIFDGKEDNLNAQEIYGPLCNPSFGPDVLYDCPSAKLMEQKKFIKYGFTQEALASYVPVIEKEIMNYIDAHPTFKGSCGCVDVPDTMAEMTMFSTARTLQGEEVRAKLTKGIAKLFVDLRNGFQPINFIFPNLALPHNKKRDAAHIKLREKYMEIIAQRRRQKDTHKPDMISNLMQRSYVDGYPIPDEEIAYLMMTLLVAGQHSTSTILSWILLHLANEPEITEKLYAEQLALLPLNPNGTLQPLKHDHLTNLPLHSAVVKETLRLHNPVHSVLRKVTSPMRVPNTQYTIPPGHAVLASPLVSATSPTHFPDPMRWDPHRWSTSSLDSKSESIQMTDYGYGPVPKSSRSAFLPFGGGMHHCVGEKFAETQLLVVTAVLVRTFKFRNIMHNKLPEPEYVGLMVQPKHPAIVRWERRDGVKPYFCGNGNIMSKDSGKLVG